MASRSAKDYRKNQTGNNMSSRSAKYYRTNEEDLKEFYDSFQAIVDNWSKARDDYFKETENYYTNRDLSVYGLDNSKGWKDTVSSKHTWLENEALRINSILDEYGDYFDSDAKSKLKTEFADSLTTSSKFVKQADTDINFWNEFKDEGEYQNYYFSNKYNGKSYTDVLKALESADGNEKDWLTNNSQYFMSSKEAQAEIDKLSEYKSGYSAIETELNDLVNQLTNAYRRAGYGSKVEEMVESNSRVAKLREQLKGYDKNGTENRIAELTEIKGQATLKENNKVLEDEAKSDKEFSSYVALGESKGMEKEWDFYVSASGGIPMPERTYSDKIVASRNGEYVSDGDAKDLARQMTDEQYNNYLYFLGKYGKKKAQEYLDTIEYELNTKSALEIQKSLEGTVILPQLFGFYAGVDSYWDNLEGIFSDGYKAPSSTQIASGLVREDQDWFGKITYDLANTTGHMTPSILGSMAATSLLGPAGLGVAGATGAKTAGQAIGAGLMGMSAMGGAKQEMLNLGYSNAQATTYGILTGASEACLQYALGGVGKLGGKWTDDAVKALTKGINKAGVKFAIEFGGEMASEALEESLQEVLNPFFKKVATGKNEGVDWAQVGYNGLLGALSAGLLNGLGAGANRIGETILAKKMMKDGNVGKLQEVGKSFDKDTLAYKLADGLDSYKKIENKFAADTLGHKLVNKVNNNIGAWKLADLIHEMHGTLSEQNVADIKYELVRNGMVESDAESIAGWLAKAVDGDNFTATQRKALDNNPIISRVFKKVIIDKNSTVNQRLQAMMDLEGTVGQAGVDYSAIYKSQSKEGLTASANFHQALKSAQTDAIKQRFGIGRTALGDTDSTIDSMVADTKKAMSKGKVSESGVTTDSTTGKQISIKKVKSNDGTQMTYELANGSIIDSKNVEYANDDEGILHEHMLEMGYDADIANAIINGRSAVSDMPIMTYLNGIDEAIEYGKIGYPMEKISSNGFYAELPNSMKTYAYNLGKDSAKKATAMAQAKVDSVKGKAETAKEGKVIVPSTASLTDRQRTSIETLGKVVADVTHNKVVFFNTEKKGNAIVFAEDVAGHKKGTKAPNGFYERATGTIYIDLNAGQNGEGVILWTAAHELTHFIRQWSPAKFKVLADFLMAEYGKMGVDIETLIDQKIAEAKAQKKNLTRDKAYEEVVADSMQMMFTDTNLAYKLEKLKNKDKSLWGKIKEFFRDLYARITKEYKGLDPQTEEAKLVHSMGKTIEKISDLFAEAIVDAGNTFANAEAMVAGEVDINGDPSSHDMSLRSMVEGSGLYFDYNTKTGQIRVLEEKGGVEVTSVDKEQIKNSPLGNMVTLAVENKFLTKSEAEVQYGFLSDLVNLCLNYKENFTMVWEIAGTQVFSAIKANSDTQYGKTIDFSTVCKKTQQVINVISETQKRLKRGLTKDEIKNIVYYETGKAGEPTPCPVCYVFSRWMGIGGILQQMHDFQEKYKGVSEEGMRDFINDVESEIINYANTPGKSGKVKDKFFDKNGKVKFGQVIAELKSKATNKIKSADIRLKIQETETLLAKADVKDKAKLQKTLDRLNKKLATQGDILDAKLKDAEALMSRYEEYQWLTKTYMDEVKAEDGSHIGWKLDPNFKPVADEVLWDLREGARFATEYPKSWIYRTTKGCNAGKAILPYSDARVGETLQGVAYSNVKDIIVGEGNAFLNGDVNAQRDYVTKAIKKQLAQNLIGGMRYQSTSDFRYEYGSDYLITFLEMQAIGAKVQLYTKVIEAVDFLCSVGAEVNLSVMPLNDGYVTLDDGRKQLVFSSVTGINAEAAIAKTKQYDNAQLILVGISDEHIRLALEGDDVNGDVVTFVIPFHGSGNTVKAIQELMDLLGEDLDVTKAQDYSLVQTDHFAKNRTAEQVALWDLRKKIISRSYSKNGKNVAWDGVLTTAEEALLNGANGSKYLKDLYNRFYVDKTADEYGVALSTAQAEQIFPYEYWDKSLTYAEADRNGERFKEYCATMGIVPRFSGVDSTGKKLGFGDFTNNKGYWKLLIDRKMYNNDGTYHSPKKINVTDFKVETLDPAWGSATYGDVMQKDTNPKKTNAITENVIRQIEKKDSTEDSFDYSERSPYDGKKLYENGEVYDYSFMVSLDNMEVKSLPPLSSVKDNGKISQSKVVSLGLENAKSIGKEITPTQYAIKNAYTKRDIILGTNGLNHSLDASNISRLRTNARLSAIGGYIVQNAIPVNGLKKENKQANGTYAMACLLKDGDGYVVAIVTVDEFSSQAIDFDFVEITHSINGRFIAKKEDSRSSTRELELGQESISTTTISTISIADFLEIVNSTHRSILSDNVLKHFEESRPEGHYTDRVLFSERTSQAVEHFGTTSNFEQAGFCVADGRMLNLGRSGNVYHSQIGEIFDDAKGRDAVNRFIQEGNVRLVPGSPGVEIGETPVTTNQLNVISRFVGNSLRTRGYFYLDITGKDGDTIASVEYEEDSSVEDIIYDIKAYYERGRVPSQKSWYSYSERTSNATDNRTLLANALETVAQNDVERSWLAKYKSQIESLNADQNELSKIRAKIKEARFTKGADRSQLSALENKAKILADRISRADKKLLNLEVSKPLQGVLEREKARAEKKGRQMLAEYREQRTQSLYKTEVRAKIKNFKKRLEGMLQHPTDRQYIPMGLASAMIDVCELINTDTSLYHKDGSINKAQERRNLTKEKLNDLKNEYENLKNIADPMYSGEFDETVYAYLTDLQKNFGGKNLADMTLDELREMYETLRAIDETLRDARKLIGFGDVADVYEAGDSIAAEQAEITNSRKNGKRNQAQKTRDKTLFFSMSPVRNAERMSGYNQDSFFVKLFKKFEQGKRKKNMFVMESYKSFEALTTGENAKTYEDSIYSEYGGKTYTDINGRTFGISKMQMMQTILSYEREVANQMHHIEGSGFSFADLDMLRKGKLKDAVSEEYSHRVPSAVDMVESFKAELAKDKWAQDYMAEARRFFNEKAKDAINETMLVLKHRIIAKDKNYIPFEVDKNFVVREISADNDIQQTINSYGMLKETKSGASQPLIITGLNNILDRHIDQVGTVYGLAIEVRNFNKVWNVRTMDSVGSDPTVKTAIQRNWGIEGVDHIEQAVKDIQSPRKSTQSALYRKIRSNYIGATFLLNLSVVTKQIGSLFASTSMLRYRSPIRMIGNLVHTMVNYKKIAAEVDKYTATAWVRRQGLSDAELQTLYTEGKKTLVGKLINKLPSAINPTKWIQGMDSAVALSLWKYAKQDVAKNNPELSGEELLKATAEFYDDVIENTQSMTDELHRPEVQKRGDWVTDAFGMFKTDLYQMAGQLQVTAGRYTANKSKENKKALARTVYSVVMSAVWGQLMTTLFALLRYKVDHYRDEEDEELTAESWLKRQSFALTGDIVGYLFPLLGSEIVGIIENFVYGESEDAVDNIVITAVNDVVDTIYMVGSGIEEGEMPSVEDSQKLVTKSLQLLGIPANNIARFINAVHLHSKDIANGEFLSFEAGVERSPKNLVHSIVEATASGKSDVAKGLFEEAVEELALRKAKDGEVGDDEISDATSSLKTALGNKYKDGDVDIITATEILSSLFGMTESEIYYQLDKWDYAEENGNTENYEKYDDIFTAMEEGDPSSAIEEHVERLTEHYLELAQAKAEQNGTTFNERKAKKEAESKAESAVKSGITAHWKPLYKEAYKKGDTEEMKRIRYMLRDTKLYGSTSDVLDTVKGWLKS